MRIAVGCDHGGFAPKEALVGFLRRAGHRVTDLGTFSKDAVDYPDFAGRVALAVSRGLADRGVLLCGTGIGMAMAANKVRGVRAAAVWSVPTARLAAEHNHANILCLGGRQFRTPDIVRMTRAWLSTPFGVGRHSRRLRKIRALERRTRPARGAD